MRLAEPLRPKNPDGILRVVVCARISKPTQDPESNVAQQEDAERFLAREYAGRADVQRFSDQGSGWLPDRPGISAAQAAIATGRVDVVLVNELREVYRNPRFAWAFVQDCLDHDARLISIADNIDTANENWEHMMHVACLLHGMTVPETRRRVRRKATHAFAGGGMVMKVRYGFRKLTKQEAQSGQFGPRGLRIAKADPATAGPVLHRMRVMRLAGTSYEAIADWLTDEGVPTGSYATKRRWTGKLVEALLRDPILSGRRQFCGDASRLEYGSGKHKRKDQPAPPERKDWPELAYFKVAEHEELLAAMDAAAEAARRGHPAGRESPLYNVPRARSLWPGQSIRCGVCGGWFYRYGAVMKCMNARGKGPKYCWNRVQVRVDQVHEKVLPLVLDFLDQHPGVRGVMAQAAWRECQRLRGRQNRSAAALDDTIAVLGREAKNLAKSIRKRGPLESLESELASVEEELAKARTERARLAAADDGVGAYRSVEELEADLDRAVRWLAGASRDFADVLRRLIITFVVVPVQGVTGGQVRPRATVVLSPAAWAAGGEAAPEVSTSVDLFDPPEYIRRLRECVEERDRDPHASLMTLGARLKLNHMQVKRGTEYHAAMQTAGASAPYQELTGPPPAPSRWRGKRSRRPE